MFAFTQEDKTLSLSLSGRDPLGTQAIWQHRARDVVPSLTGGSRLSEGFHVLLTTFAWWPEMAKLDPRQKFKQRDFFLLMEQAFARACRTAGTHWSLPGNQRLHGGEPGLWVGLNHREKHHLLDSQLTNGVWGLYRIPALSAGLINERNRICESDLEFKIRSKTDGIRDVLASLAKHLKDQTPMQRCELARIATHRSVKMLAGIIDSRPFDRLIKETFVLPERSPVTADLATLSGGKGIDDVKTFIAHAIDALPQHATILTDVVCCEQFIAPLDAIFELICSATENDIDRLARIMDIDLKALSQAREQFTRSGRYDALAGQRATALLNLDLRSKRALIESLIAHHAAISGTRSSSPWIAIDDGGKLERHLAVEAPAKEKLHPTTAWRYGYYLPTLGNLAQQLKVRQA